MRQTAGYENNQEENPVATYIYQFEWNFILQNTTLFHSYNKEINDEVIC